MLYAWRSPHQLVRTTFPSRTTAARTFSLILPARHEAEVLGRTLDRLADLDHPRYEVIVVVGEDDPDTAAAAEAAARARPDRVRVLVDDSWPKTCNGNGRAASLV